MTLFQKLYPLLTGLLFLFAFSGRLRNVHAVGVRRQNDSLWSSASSSSLLGSLRPASRTAQTTAPTSTTNSRAREALLQVLGMRNYYQANFDCGHFDERTWFS
ncbi:hypothetical protein EDB87DRAFT_1574630 [Lactarius vividus]|nr:hypothetical protein EDB87DRAFT_1574630 [Lactarius vividus]